MAGTQLSETNESSDSLIGSVSPPFVYSAMNTTSASCDSVHSCFSTVEKSWPEAGRSKHAPTVSLSASVLLRTAYSTTARIATSTPTVTYVRSLPGRLGAGGGGASPSGGGG